MTGVKFPYVYWIITFFVFVIAGITLTNFKKERGEKVLKIGCFLFVRGGKSVPEFWHSQFVAETQLGNGKIYKCKQKICGVSLWLQNCWLEVLCVYALVVLVWIMIEMFFLEDSHFVVTHRLCHHKELIYKSLDLRNRWFLNDDSGRKILCHLISGLYKVKRVKL